MKKTELERHELVDAIESGQFKTSSGNKLVSIVLTVFCFAIFATMAFASLRKFGLSQIKNYATSPNGFAQVMMASIPFLFVFFIIFSATRKRGADLGKLSATQRKLILEGEKIEAELNAVEEARGLFIMHCSAEYAGQQLNFVSPGIAVRPIPFEERKIRVFINPQKPSQYLIDIYSHLPRMCGNIIRDRSEIKHTTGAKSDESRTAQVVATIILLIFAAPFVLYGLMALRYNLISSVLCLTIGIAGPYLILRSLERRRNMIETLLEKGDYIEATGTRYWVTRDDDGDETYHLSMRYIEPDSNYAHEFITTGPSAMHSLVGAKVRVFVNPDDTRHYHVDIKTSLKELGFTTSRTKE